MIRSIVRLLLMIARGVQYVFRAIQRNKKRREVEDVQAQLNQIDDAPSEWFSGHFDGDDDGDGGLRVDTTPGTRNAPKTDANSDPPD